MARAGFYIDGFNMYGAICEIRQNHLKWLSYRRIADLLAPDDDQIIKFFTAIRGADSGQDVTCSTAACCRLASSVPTDP